MINDLAKPVRTADRVLDELCATRFPPGVGLWNKVAFALASGASKQIMRVMGSIEPTQMSSESSLTNFNNRQEPRS